MGELYLYLLLLLWALSRYYWYFNTSETQEYTGFSKDEWDTYNGLLDSSFPYYNRLSPAGKQKFIGRLIDVLHKVPVVGREGMAITIHEKTLIAASVTQLTFGFNKAHIPFLKGVVVYPDIFYSRLLNAWVKGLSMGNGHVFLSYAHFTDGYRESEDTYNLGLHEFAHVLRFQANEMSFFDERLSAYFEEWEEVGYPVFMETRSREQDFFREYGGTNSAEFFSVCIENFFEVPALFREELPELYYHLCFLMKQDPLNTQEDYRFDEAAVQLANQSITRDLPIYKLWNSHREVLMLETMHTFIWLMGVIAMIVFVSVSDNAKWIYFRSLVISSCILFSVRFIYYRNYKAVLNRRYIIYFCSKIAPILGFMAIVFSFG